MVEERRENENFEKAERPHKRLRVAVIALITAAVICCLIWISRSWKFQSVDEQIAAIEAARAIPDEENAAVIYNQLLENYDENALSIRWVDDKAYDSASDGPWQSKDYPKVAQWVEDRQDIILKLLEAGKKDKCRFPIIIDQQQFNQHIDLMPTIRWFNYVLVLAGNNDIAEGRIDAGLEKYLCILQMANHLCQQPVMIDYLVCIAVEALALGRINSFILEGDAAETHLRTIETGLPETKDNWTEILEPILKVEKLFQEKTTNFFVRLTFRRLAKDTLDRCHELYLRLLTDRRGMRILIALRRYKSKTGQWPQSLEEIKANLPSEILIDPSNNNSFVYRLTEEGFTLYSKGKNNIDEDGQYNSTWDPNSYEFKVKEDDWPIWPRRTRKTKQENANDE